MRCLFGFICVLALGVMGCGGGGNGGSGGDRGVGGDGGVGGGCGAGGDGGGTVACVDGICPCTEAGILAAIEAGGDDPYTFDCNGPTTVGTEAGIVIDNDVILDGEGNLTVAVTPLSGDPWDPVFAFSVPTGVKAELHRLTADSRISWDRATGGVVNEGTLTIRECVISGSSLGGTHGGGGRGVHNAGEMSILNSTVSENDSHGRGGGIYNGCSATLTLVNSTVSDNFVGSDGGGPFGGGIFNEGEMTIINSTVSGNRAESYIHGEGGRTSGGGIVNAGWMSLTNSTVSGNSADSGEAIAVHARSCRDLHTEIANTLIDGDCDDTDGGSDPVGVSKGYNIESPGDTCGFDQGTDQFDVSADDLKLGELADNGGPTMTHALGAGSVAIDHIPALDCEVDEDQRGEPRPETGGTMCDVGAFEVQL
jgi:hypothetical protein